MLLYRMYGVASVAELEVGWPGVSVMARATFPPLIVTVICMMVSYYISARSGGHLVGCRQLTVETRVLSCRHILRGRQDVCTPICGASGQKASLQFQNCVSSAKSCVLGGGRCMSVPWFSWRVWASSPYQPQGSFDFCLKCFIFLFFFSVKGTGIHYCIARTSKSSEVSSYLKIIDIVSKLSQRARHSLCWQPCGGPVC
jgi:hypothetical protein